MLGLSVAVGRTKRIYRIAVGSLFFCLGICSASWASRIPTIQQQLQISDSFLGIILFALPVGSLISLVFAGRLVTRYSSKLVAGSALSIYSLALYLVGLSQTVPVLITSLIFFGMAGNTANIAINTQAVSVEEKYGRNIMASFHGLWSLAGFSAAAFGSLMIGNNIIPQYHFIIITAIILAGLIACFQYLLPEEPKPNIPKKRIGFIHKSLVRLGIIAFCCMMCEGAMFDWSGIYFQKVVGAKKEWIGAGYTAFMLTMATGRFIADWLVSRIGFNKTIQLSGFLIALGLGIAIAFPFVITSVIGFFIVGFGVSSVVPIVYSQAGKSKITNSGMALAAVSSIGFLGFLIGPPLIGLVAGVFSLRISFLLIACVGIAIILIMGCSKEISPQNARRPLTAA